MIAVIVLARTNFQLKSEISRFSSAATSGKLATTIARSGPDHDLEANLSRKQQVCQSCIYGSRRVNLPLRRPLLTKRLARHELLYLASLRGLINVAQLV